MAQSSFHMANSSGGALIHNERVFDIEHAIDSSARNDYLQIADIDTTVEEAKADYQANQKNHRRISSEAKLVKEAIVNLNENHTMGDVQKMTDMLEKKYGYKAMHIAIHRDEGYIDKETNEKHFNYHAHIMLLNYDFQKHRTVRPTKAQLSRMQTDVAKSLNMERGKISNKVHAKEQGVTPQIPSKRLNSFEYKRAKEEESEAVQIEKLSVKQVRADMEILRREMASAKQFKKENYDALNKLKKELKKDTVQEVYQEFQKMREDIKSAIEEKKALEQKLQKQNTKVEKLETKIVELHEELSKPSPAEMEFRSELEELQAKISELKQIAKDLNIELEKPKPEKSDDSEEQTLEEQVKSLKSQVKALTKAIDTEMYVRSSFEKMQKENTKLQSENNSQKRLINALQSKIKAKDDQILALEQKTPNTSDFDTKEVKKEIDDAINQHFQLEDLHQEVEEEGLFKRKKSYEPVEKITVEKPDTFFQKVRQMAMRGTEYAREKFDDLKEKYESLKQNYENLLDQNFHLQYENGELKKQLKEKKETPEKYNNELNTIPDLEERPKKQLSDKEVLEKFQKMKSQMVDLKELQKKLNQKNKTKTRGYRQR